MTSDLADRYRTVAGDFTRRVQGVSPGSWSAPAPCEGWQAIDIVRHLVEWIPGYFGSNAGLTIEVPVAVDDDPVAAWASVDQSIQAAMDDPEVAAREIDFMGAPRPLAEMVDMICTGDLLIHTWDLARATGQDERLDPTAVERMFTGIEPMDDALRSSGQFGPRVAVPDDADLQTKLIAFTGRQP